MANSPILTRTALVTPKDAYCPAKRVDRFLQRILSKKGGRIQKEESQVPAGPRRSTLYL